MHILIVHGYLLKGTGSNLYVNNLSKTFLEMGHQVSLFCQEDQVKEIPFIEECLAFEADNRTTKLVYSAQNRACNLSCDRGVKVYIPHLGGLLPVYVYDDYKGFQVKEYTDMEPQEIEAYLWNNATALEHFLHHNPVDLVISNHTIMQPVYTGRALTRVCQNKKTYRPPHMAVIHGSALNFSVRKSKSLHRYALEGINNVDRVVFVSTYLRQNFIDYFHDHEQVKEKATVIPAGVDTAQFKPVVEQDEKWENIHQVAQFLTHKTANTQARSRGAVDRARYLQELKQRAADNRASFTEAANQIRDQFETWVPDVDAGERLERNIDWDKDPVVMFFGKYLWTKGVQLIIACAPLILKDYPRTKFIFSGFGSSRELFEYMIYCLHYGYREAFRDILDQPWYYDKQADDNLKAKYFAELQRYLQNPKNREKYFSAVEDKIMDHVIFTGILNHKELQYLLPCVKVTAAPSIFPEAFGLVAVESLASGIIPVLTRHSAFTDIISLYADEFKDMAYRTGEKFQRLHIGEDLVFRMVGNIKMLLRIYENMTEAEKSWIGFRAHKLMENHFSWPAVAEQFIEKGKAARQTEGLN